MKTNLESPDLPLQVSNSDTTDTTTWLSLKEFPVENHEGSYIIRATQNSIQFYDISFQPISPEINKHPLISFIKEIDLYSYTIVCYPMKSALKRHRSLGKSTVTEVLQILEEIPDAMLIYIVAHKTGGHPSLIAIGGDCYRPERINFYSMLIRTNDLAVGMLRKSVMIFPDIPALTGGKKGEFGIINSRHESISSKLSLDAIFELSAMIMPIGVNFLNHIKGYNTFDGVNSICPDSLSPDVFTGARWGKYTDLWIRSGINPMFITCIPSETTSINSSIPTATGVLATTKALVDVLFDNGLSNQHILCEGYGGVGSNTIRMLIEEYGVSASQITVVDSSPNACKDANSTGVTVINSDANVYYRSLGDSSKRFDIWINNGVGDTLGMLEAINLLHAGVKIFVGGANNLFKVDELGSILDLIASQKAYAFPDWATSGGGWTYAVIEQVKKTGINLNAEAIVVVQERNRKMVDDILKSFESGEDLWRKMENKASILINQILKKHYNLTPADFHLLSWRL